MAMVRKDGELGVMMAEAWQRGTVEMRTVQPEADSYNIYSSYAMRPMPRQANRMLRIDPCCSSSRLRRTVRRMEALARPTWREGRQGMLERGRLVTQW